jgi:tRNA pseudouridine55 synthase
MFSFLVVDKPQGLTSHDVVAAVRRGIRAKANNWRVGHAGTLDPMATGVLVVCIGGATRLSEYVMASRKQYQAVIRLGIDTDTYDAEGKVTAQIDEAAVMHITRAQVEAALVQGEQDQTPPMFSAIKQGGQKLYDLARKGEEVTRAARRVSIQSTVTDYDPPHVRLHVECSAGTYIRSIAHDLGHALGVGAHLTALRRTQSGHLADPIDWSTLQSAFADGTWARHARDEKEALRHIPALWLDDAATNDVLHGRQLATRPDHTDVAGALARAYAPNGQFIAILTRQDQGWKPEKVFHPAGEKADPPLFPDTAHEQS